MKKGGKAKNNCTIRVEVPLLNVTNFSNWSRTYVTSARENQTDLKKRVFRFPFSEGFWSHNGFNSLNKYSSLLSVHKWKDKKRWMGCTQNIDLHSRILFSIYSPVCYFKNQKQKTEVAEGNVNFSPSIPAMPIHCPHLPK